MTARCCMALSLASALWLCAPARRCAGQARGQRVLLIEHGRDAFLERIGAEIEKLGFALIRRDTRAPLEAAARAEQAQAALRVLPTRTGVEVWMADATSGRSLLRQVVIDENPDGPDLELIALQTAELLRTSLLGEKAPREAEPHIGAVQTTAPAEQSEPAAGDKKTAVQLWCGALHGLGGVSTTLALGLSLQHFFGERWGVGLDVGLPLLPGTVKAVEGSARLATYFAGALALIRFRPHAGRFFATLGVGAASLMVRYSGKANEPLQAQAGTRFAGAAYLRGDLGIVTNRWLRFGVRALVGASFPRVSVTFAGNHTANFGPALLAGFGFAEVSFLEEPALSPRARRHGSKRTSSSHTSKSPSGQKVSPTISSRRKEAVGLPLSS
jgi:hypothetical protein